MIFHSRPRSELWQLFLLVIVVAGSALLLPADPKGGPTSVKFDQERYDQLARKPRDIILIGNSMLNTRLDKRLFDAMARPNSVGYLAEGGTRSFAWFLKLKNFALVLDPPPALVFIFYRDYDFTLPGLKLEGGHLETARTFLKPEDEPLLEFHRTKGMLTAPSALDHYLPDQLTMRLRSRVKDLAADIGAAGSSPGGGTRLQEELNRLFEFQNLRADVFDEGASVNDILSHESKRFTTDPAQTLLGQFNSLAKAQGVRLVFYRVKRRPDAQNTVVQDGDLLAYTGAFRSWAESQGHLLLDETDDPRLTLAMYHDGDHLGKAAKAVFTQLFFERVKFCLPRPPHRVPPP